jgi:hypothetical protein
MSDKRIVKENLTTTPYEEIMKLRPTYQMQCNSCENVTTAMEHELGAHCKCGCGGTWIRVG